MGIEPIEKRTDARGGKSNVMICRAVIDTQSISIWLHNMAAGKDDISNISNAFIVFFCAKDPLVATDQAALRSFEVKEC
jgi:hypothetical protein